MNQTQFVLVFYRRLPQVFATPATGAALPGVEEDGSAGLEGADAHLPVTNPELLPQHAPPDR